jgi:hypothetical protein
VPIKARRLVESRRTNRMDLGQIRRAAHVVIRSTRPEKAP